MSASVRSGDVLSALLYLLTKSNTTVGLIQGVNGVVQMLTALPTGVLADRHRRDTMLRAGAAVGAAAGGVLAAALLLRPTVWVLGLAMALLGCYRGVYSAALEAIFADSIAQGRRWAGEGDVQGGCVETSVAWWSRLPVQLCWRCCERASCFLLHAPPCSGPFTLKYSITLLASSFGPWLSLGLFHHLGNRWDAQDCRLVLLSGVALMVPPLALMCLFDDDRALAHRQASQGEGPGAGQQPPRHPDAGPQDGNSSQTPLLVGAVDDAGLAGGSSDAEAGCAAAGSVEQEAAQSLCAGGAGSASSLVSLAQPRRRVWLHDSVVVAALITVSDFIGAFASGELMTWRSARPCVQPKPSALNSQPCPHPPARRRNDHQVFCHVFHASCGHATHHRVPRRRAVAAGHQPRIRRVPVAVQARGAGADQVRRHMSKFARTPHARLSCVPTHAPRRCVAAW